MFDQKSLGGCLGLFDQNPWLKAGIGVSTEGVSAPGIHRFLLTKKTLSEGGGWCVECTEGVSAPGVQKFVRGLGFCLTKTGPAPAPALRMRGGKFKRIGRAKKLLWGPNGAPPDSESQGGHDELTPRLHRRNCWGATGAAVRWAW